MKVRPRDYKYKNPLICHIYPKQIELDRMLVSLYILLKHNGRRPVTKTGRDEVTIDFIVNGLIKNHSNSLVGFVENKTLVADWLYSDLVDMVNRGNPEREKVAAPLPLHLNAYKLRNEKQVRTSDSGSSEQLFSMIKSGDPELVDRLKRFLSQGMGEGLEEYDEETALDLDTLMVVRMVDNPNLKESPSGAAEALASPLCTGQARLLSNDLRRLLVYEGHVPRPVLIGYIRTIMGLHLGLYLLRLFHQVAGWVHDKGAQPSCLGCPVDPKAQSQPFHDCPFASQNPEPSVDSLPEILIDMGDDYTSHMAQLSRDNCARHYASINEYVRSVLSINQLFQFAESHVGRKELNVQPRSVSDAVSILAAPPPGFDYHFGNRVDELFLDESADEEERQDVQAIRNMTALSSFDTYIELVALERTKYYRAHLVTQLDSLFMKNGDSCLMVQGKSRNNQRRWYIGSRLLESLVQIAVLDSTVLEGEQHFYSRPILIDEFVNWLRDRYGFTIVPNWPEATIKDYEAFNGNLKQLKNRLREIGFYTDLSDAYNAQKIRPRYEIGISTTRA